MDTRNPLSEGCTADGARLVIKKASYLPVVVLLVVVVCLMAGGGVCIGSDSGSVLLGIVLIVLGVALAVFFAARGLILAKDIKEGEVLLAPKVAPVSFGAKTDRFWCDENKGVPEGDLKAASERRARELASARRWFEFVRPSFEAVDLTASDGCRLVGHELLAGAPSQDWLVYAPGLGGTWKSGLCFARRFAQKGFNVLLLDMRSQGESGGTSVGYGHIERRDLVEWCEWIVSQNADARIVLAGFSMGAAAVVEASGELDLPDQVKAILSDSAYADLWGEAMHLLGKGNNGTSFLLRPTLDIARLAFRAGRQGLDLAAASAEEAIGRSSTPTFIVCGADDSAVPKGSSQRLALAAACEHELLVVPGAGHCCASLADPDAYYGSLFAFLDRVR